MQKWTSNSYLFVNDFLCCIECVTVSGVRYRKTYEYRIINSNTSPGEVKCAVVCSQYAAALTTPSAGPVNKGKLLNFFRLLLLN